METFQEKAPHPSTPLSFLHHVQQGGCQPACQHGLIHCAENAQPSSGLLPRQQTMHCRRKMLREKKYEEQIEGL